LQPQEIFEGPNLPCKIRKHYNEAKSFFYEAQKLGGAMSPLVLTRKFVKEPRPRDSEGSFSVFESSCHSYYLSNYSKVEPIPLSALPKDTRGLPTCSPHYTCS